MLLKVLQYSQEIPVLKSFFNKVGGLKKLQNRSFPVNSCFSFFKNTHFKEHLRMASSADWGLLLMWLGQTCLQVNYYFVFH